MERSLLLAILTSDYVEEVAMLRLKQLSARLASPSSTTAVSLAVLGMIVAIGFIALKTSAQERREHPTTAHPPTDPLAGLMLAKLASTQKIVAGLVSKDFGQIKAGGEDLARICDAIEWPINADDVYTQHRMELRRQADKFISMAQERNLDGAAFTYMHSVATCINCHQHCRDVLRIAEIPNRTSRVIPIPAVDDDSTYSNRPILR